jgi:phosphate:Na+ symporter
MSTFSIIDIFYLVGGLAIFLYGMQLGEKNLRTIGSSRLRRIISIITRHRLLAFLVGLAITLITQSSSATTVMLVSLASANLLTLHQSLGMILGSDFGTTITVQLFAFKLYHIAPLLIAFGFLGSVQRRFRSVARWGSLVLAFGFVFFGMKLMSDSVEPLRTLPVVKAVIAQSLGNPIIGFLAGAVFTAIVQSSAATLAILIAIAVSGSGEIGLAQFFPLILGANLGTCATAFLSTLRAHTEGIQVAWAHFLFKAIGALLFFPLINPASMLIERFLGSMPLQIAMAHTVFNLAIAVVFLPWMQAFSRFIERYIRYAGAGEKRFELRYLQTTALAIPAVALARAQREIERMSQLVVSMIEDSSKLVHRYSPALKDAVVEADDQVDFIHEQTIKFITQLSQEELDERSSARAHELIMVTTDLEHIGDIVSKSIAAFAQKMDDSKLPFPDAEKQHVLDFYTQSAVMLKNILAAFREGDKQRARDIFTKRAEVTAQFDRHCNEHISGLYEKHPVAIQTTSIYIDLLEEIQRINSFIFRLAAHMLEIHRAE